MLPQDQGEPEILRVFTSRRETRAFYDKISDVYDLLSEHTEAPVRAAGIDMLSIQPGERVLEIGCGTGQCLAALAGPAGPNGRVLAVDLSERMLKRSRVLLAHRGIAELVDLACADGALLPFRPAVMDAVFMSFTLELFDTAEITTVLAECKRVLEPGGRIVVVGMSKEGPGGLLVEAYEWSHRHFPNFVDCRPIFVARALEAAGFQVKEKTMQDMWLPVEVVLAEC